jgi:hypothetical protein
MLRQTLGSEAVAIVAFSTYSGTVTAAREWGDAPRQYELADALPGSHEALLHMVARGLGAQAFVLNLRAVGVVYRPDTERESHYFEACEVAGVLEMTAKQRCAGKDRRRNPAHRFFHYLQVAMPEFADSLVHVDRTNSLLQSTENSSVPLADPMSLTESSSACTSV